jgi:nitrilase
MSTQNEFPRFKAAAVQAGSVVKDAPDYFDTPATLEKAISLISEAGKNGARLIVFPEGWLPCFCYWSLDLNEAAAFQDIWAKYLRASIEVPGPETEVLCAAARNAGAYVVMGINERDREFRGRMYNSILYLGPQGQILGTHRKICNTTQERLFHTPGDGGGNLKTVFKTEIGNIGGSICSEHSQLLLTYNWIMQGIQIHCSLWPGYSWLRTTTDIRTRAVCSNGNIFGVLAATFMEEKDKPKNFYRNSLFNIPGSLCGGSGIIGPSAEYIAGPVYDREAIVYGEIDLARIDKSKYPVNLVGIYSRWDLLSLNVREEPYQGIATLGESGVSSIEEQRIIDLGTQPENK